MSVQSPHAIRSCSVVAAIAVVTIVAFAMGLSAFQPKLPTRGSLAIHGTNDNAYR